MGAASAGSSRLSSFPPSPASCWPSCTSSGGSRPARSPSARGGRGTLRRRHLQLLEVIWLGIVPQAVLGTLGVVGVTLALFASGKIRASKRATKIFLVAMVGYLVFSLVNLVLMLTGVAARRSGCATWRSSRHPARGLIGVLVVLLAAYSLVLDFDSIRPGVQRAPAPTAGPPPSASW